MAKLKRGKEIGVSKWDGQTKLFSYETEDGRRKVERTRDGRLNRRGGREILVDGWRLYEKKDGEWESDGILYPSRAAAMEEAERRDER